MRGIRDFFGVLLYVRTFVVTDGEIRMATVTDPTTDVSEHEEGIETGEEESGGLHENPPNPNHASGSNGVHRVSPGTVTDPTVDGSGVPLHENDGVQAHGDLGIKHGIEFSPAPAHPRQHSAGIGLFSFLSGNGTGGPLRGGSEGIPRHGSGTVGGIYRGRSGVHLPSLASLTFSMSRLPEEDAGLQMHLTETKEVETLPESPFASDEDSAPRKPVNRMRKHLTVIGACSFGFRLAECVLSLISFVVMCANSQYMGVDFGNLKFNHFQAYRYLVAVNIIVFVYSTLQFIQLAYTVILGISFIPSIFLSTWLTFGFDQLFSYLLLSASTSAATVANLSYTGEMGVRLCPRYDLGSFCARADAAVTMSFFTFLSMLSSTILAIYRIVVLLRD